MFNADMKMNFLQINPYMLDRDDGERHEAFGALVCIKASGEQTGGAFNLLEALCPVGFATPLHIHYAEDVAIFILEGSLTFFLGEKKIEASAGSYFFQPRGMPHGFRVAGFGQARILYLTHPAGIDKYIFQNEFRSRCIEFAARHKIEILGSLPS